MKRFVMLTEIEEMARRLTRANWNRLAFAHDTQRYEEAKKEADAVWKKMQELQKLTDEQLERKRKGLPADDMFL